jgi:hypothetical protein
MQILTETTAQASPVSRRTLDQLAGETSMQSTVLLCSAHHRLLHEGGFTIQQNFAGDWYFRNGNGKALPSHPAPTPEPTCNRYRTEGMI